MDPEIEARLYTFIETYLARKSKDSDGWVSMSLIIHEQRERLVTDSILQTYWQEFFDWNPTHGEIKFVRLGFSNGISWKEEYEQRCKSILSVEIARSIRKYTQNLKPFRIPVVSLQMSARDARVELPGNTRVFLLEIDESKSPETPLTTDTPVTLKVEINEYSSSFFANGIILGQDEVSSGKYYVAFDKDPSEYRGSKALFVDRKALHLELAERIDGINHIPDLFALIACNEVRSSTNTNLGDSDEVPHLIADRKDSKWTSLIWGPPGTGKSYAIAQFLELYLRRHSTDSVLLVAPTNQAVDSLTNQILRFRTNASLARIISTRGLLRYGFPKDTEVLAIPEINGPADFDSKVLRINQSLNKIKEAILSGADQELIAHQKLNLFEMQRLHRDNLRNHASSCQVVATTTTQSFLKSVLHRFPWVS